MSFINKMPNTTVRSQKHRVNTMGKVLTLLIIILLALVSAAGYLLLTGEIRSGEKQMAEGQRWLEQGQDTLEKGKVKLADGKKKLADGKKEYAQANNSPVLVFLDKFLNAGRGFKGARASLAKGRQQVAKGEAKVEAGEDRVDAGELKLSQGRERLMLAKGGRVACAVGTIFFTALSIVFGFRM